jgi:putative nucleotidyltransferase with HDIG domain
MLVAALDKLRGAGTAHDALLDPEAEVQIEGSRARTPQPLSDRERIGEAIAASGFVIAAVALAVSAPWERGFSAPLAAWLVVLYLVAFRVRFVVGAAHTAPTQLVFVPMLFLLPVPAVPLLVAAANFLGYAPDYFAGRRHPERAITSLGDSWTAVGPAFVLVAAGVSDPGLEHWPVYLLALAAQFACELLVNTPREWFELGIKPRAQLAGIEWVWSVDLLLSALGLLAAIAAIEHRLAVVLVVPLIILLAMFARERQFRIDSALQLSDAYRGTTMVLADIVEADDEYTGVHSRTVVTLALEVARELGLDARQQRLTEFGALLHDVGKIAVPKEIINKPGPLTPAEWDLVKVHTVDGERILGRVGGFLAEVGRVVRSSHERWDGNGYPDGLYGDEIPIESRIVSCCDAYNAITTDRPYRPAQPSAVAVAELRENAGSQFDPRVVETLMRVLEGEATPSDKPADVLTAA